MHTATLTDDARLIVFDGQTHLGQLEAAAIQEAFKACGLLLFRGFDADLDGFRAFSARFSRQSIVSPGAAKADGTDVQLIRPLGYPQDLHQENGFSASRPDLLWFFCENPARADGETTYADGIRVWQALSEPTRQLFLTRRVKYASRLRREQWLVDGYLNVRTHVGHLRMAGSIVRFDQDDMMVNEYVTSAVSTTKWGGAQAFVNSLRGPYMHLTTTFEDDAPIPAEAIEEIDAVHARLAQEIRWQPRDFVMIDNTRYLHGRRAFRDPQRKVYSSMALANF